IDDPVPPTSPSDARALQRARELPTEIQTLLHEPGRASRQALTEYLRRQTQGALDPSQECQELAAQYRTVARWFAAQAQAEPCADHTDAFFTDKIWRDGAQRYQAEAEQIVQHATVLHDLPQDQAEAWLSRGYARLAMLFHVRLLSFERK